MVRVEVCLHTWPELNTEVKAQVRRLHNMCFPDDADDDSPLDEFFDRLTFLMETSQCVWFLLWKTKEGLSSSESRQLIGMMGCTEYHDSMYAFALCIHPSFRRRRLSRKIMLEAALYAHDTKGFNKLSGSVDSTQTRLLSFYLNMDGIVETTGLCSPGTETSTVRISHTFDAQSVRLEKQELDAWIESEFSSPSHQWLIRTLCSALIAGIVWSLFKTRNIT